MWLVSVLIALLVGGGSGYVSTRPQGERIAVLESQIGEVQPAARKAAVLEAQMADVRYQLQAIDRKLDRLLESDGKAKRP